MIPLDHATIRHIAEQQIMNLTKKTPEWRHIERLQKKYSKIGAKSLKKWDIDAFMEGS
jgi:hypothetical protein